MTDPRPVGVFDSGVGGLSVLGEIRARLPAEDLLYVADSRHAPYGEKSPDFIRARALAITRFLIGQGAKAVVVACNTATAAAAGLLRETFPVPILAMEPAVRPAAAATRRRIVGVLATAGTLESARFAALLARFGEGIQVLARPCPGLVERVEQGDLDGPATRALLEHYARPLLDRGADTLILGCTHYPFLRPLLAGIAGPEVVLIDTGAAVARHLAATLAAQGLAAPERAGGERFWSSAGAGAAAAVMGRLWGRRVAVDSLPDWAAAGPGPGAPA